MAATFSDLGRRPVIVMAAAATVVAVALAAVLCVAVTRTSRANAAARTDDQRQDVLAAAQQIAVDFTTIDYRTLTNDLKRIASVGTTDFQTKTLGTNSNQVAELIIGAKGTSTGQVVANAVGSMTATTAEAFVAVNAHVVNKLQPKGAEQYYRLDIHLQKVRGRWLAESVDTLA